MSLETRQLNLQQTNVSGATWQDVRAEGLIKETAITIPMRKLRN